MFVSSYDLSKSLVGNWLNLYTLLRFLYFFGLELDLGVGQRTSRTIYMLISLRRTFWHQTCGLNWSRINGFGLSSKQMISNSFVNKIYFSWPLAEQPYTHTFSMVISTLLISFVLPVGRKHMHTHAKTVHGNFACYCQLAHYDTTLIALMLRSPLVFMTLLSSQ